MNNPPDKEPAPVPQSEPPTGRTKRPPTRGAPVTLFRDDKHCHCQGHRLAIVIGPRRNDAIQAALQWLASLSNVQHKLFFDDKIDNQPAFDKPQLIQAGGIAPFPATTPDAVSEFFKKECKDCCHWDEVILLCHGGQARIWYALLKNLANLLDDRPVRKFVLWMCKSAREFCPQHPDTYEGRKYNNGKPEGQPERLVHINLFEQITWILKPKNCSVPTRCDCDHPNCVCFNADGERTPPHCPDGTESVKLLCAAWYGVRLQDEDTKISRPSPLGLQQDGDGKWELTSPDGNLREVTIGADGSVTTAKPESSDDVFAHTPLKENQNLKDGETESTTGQLSAAARRKPTSVEAPNPDPTPTYKGPKCCPDTGGEGCQPDAV
jgi:hypothetical protein